MEVLLDCVDEVVIAIDKRTVTQEANTVLASYFEMLNNYQGYLTTEATLIHAELVLRQAHHTHFYCDTRLEGLLCNLDSLEIIQIIAPLLTPHQ